MKHQNLKWANTALPHSPRKRIVVKKMDKDLGIPKTESNAREIKKNGISDKIQRTWGLLLPLLWKH